MSYQVIARKWRPKNFQELAGQAHISQTLLNALRSHRLPHALLFTGPRGTGKTSTARILAKALRCPDAKDFIPCDQCQECLDTAAGRNIDVIEIDGASNNGVDAIRELRDTVGYMPSSGNFKIYIIDEVHMLSTSAFNALLKTLEEPPEHIVFILATTEVHKIPNTILSRCQRFDFRRIPLKVVAERLAAICAAEKVKADEQSLWAIARQGDGSLRDSQSLLDQVITYCDGNITLQKVIEALGLTDRHLLTETLTALVQRNDQKVMQIVEKLFSGGLDPRLFVQDLLEELRHLLIIKLSPQAAHVVVDLPEAEIELLKGIGEKLSPEDVHLLFDMTLKGANDIARAQDPRIVLEMLLLRMSAAPRVESLAKAFASPTQPPINSVASFSSPQSPAKKKISPSAAPGPNVSSTFNASPAPLTTSPNDRWADFVARISKVNKVFAAQLEHTSLIEIINDRVIVGVPAKMKFLVDKLQDRDTQNKLNNYLGTFWGSGYKIEIQVGGDEKALSPKELEQQRKTMSENELRRQVENHPLVKSVKEVFDLEIQAIKERT